jgi:hypothetical protein
LIKVRKYTEDAVQLFGQSGINTVFTNLEGFPEDWKENPDSTPRAPPNDPVAQRTPHAGLLSAVLPAQPPEEGNPEDAGTSKPRELRYPDRVKK